VHAVASSTVLAFLLSISTYGVRLDSVLHTLIEGLTGDSHIAEQPRSQAARSGDYEADLPSSYMAADSALPSSSLADSPTRLTLAVAYGQTLAGVLAMADVPANDAAAAVDAARRVYDPRKLRAGQFITVNFKSGGGAFQGFELRADPDRLVAISRNNNGFTADQTKLALRAETRVARGVIRNSLFEATATAGIPDDPRLFL
jgi:hypothetical protein